MKLRISIQVIYLYIAFGTGIMLMINNPIIGEFVYVIDDVEYYRMFQIWGCWNSMGIGPTPGMDPNLFRLTLLSSSILLSLASSLFVKKNIWQGVMALLAMICSIWIAVALVLEYYHILGEIQPHQTFSTETPHVLWLLFLIIPQGLVAASHLVNFRNWYRGRF